ncbi:MAG: hypothetical protein JXR64_06455 [Spirochaetales bacterium]|nr:hypothetical protein [Spirochaetales bacterium]
MNINNSHIEYAIDNSKRLTLTIYKYLAEERHYIDEIVNLYLKQTELEHLAHQLTYCIHELAGNACRANTKRTYFETKKLDIFNNDEYNVGMESFKNEVFSEKDIYHCKAKEHGLYIKFQIKKTDDSIDLSILNNVTLTREEESRIKEKFEKIKGYNNVAEAFHILEDSSEGAGLGIAMMILMLKEMGLDPDRLKIFSDTNETHAVLKLPLELIPA